MIVADSSVWVDFFNGVGRPEVDRLDDALGAQEVLMGDVILLEVLRGFRRDADFRRARAALAPLPVLPMLGPAAAVRGAERYRVLRQRGVTVRKTVDVIIASACLDADVPLLFADRDFRPFVQHLGLQTA